MTEIEDTINMHTQLSREYAKLAKNHGHYFELKMLELEILRAEALLRDLGVDF